MTKIQSYYLAIIIIFIVGISCQNQSDINTYVEEESLLDSEDDLQILINAVPGGFTSAQNTKADQPVQTVDFVDIDRYTGRWFEILKFPTEFSEGCTCTTADYEAISGGLSVFNNCLLKDSGIPSSISGEAIVTDTVTNAKLEVFFEGSPFPGDYWIIDLLGGTAENEPYTFAVVSDPDRETLFILSRTPRLTKNKQILSILHIFSNLVEQGYSLNKLQLSPQPVSCAYP